MEKAIIVKNVTKKYKLYQNSRERFLDLVSPKQYGEEFYALSGVDFEANIGEVVGFIGINGSGKSTLSNIIAGIVPETSGEVITNGEVSLIAVAAGLKNDLTGRDNIELKLLMLGFDKQEIKALEQDIIEFSELEEFIDQPVKSYSSGMKSRLGFAISVNVDPDILIIDEALSVGDRAFADKSLAKMKEFKESGKTMIFVSHSISQMRKFCDKILWLEFGKVKAYGKTEEIIPQYENFINQWKKLTKEERDLYRQKVLQDDPKAQKLLQPEKKELTIKPVSRMARIRTPNAKIYSDINDLSKSTSTKKYLKSSYYIKKRANKNNETYFLLSDLPSGVEGVIGWVKKEHVSNHTHILIDQDSKQFKIKGTGTAYDRPWGQKKDEVYNLEQFEGETFEATETHRIARSFWYYGRLNDKDVWIRHKHLIML